MIKTYTIATEGTFHIVRSVDDRSTRVFGSYDEAVEYLWSMGSVRKVDCDNGGNGNG